MGVDKLIDEIYSIIRVMAEHNMGELSGDTLSRLAVKLASYKASLGEHVAYANKAALDAEAAYKLAKADSYKQLRADGKGSTDAGELKNLELSEVIAASNEAKYRADVLQKLSIDCHDLIDAIKSRLIVLQTERSESNVT